MPKNKGIPKSYTFSVNVSVEEFPSFKGEPETLMLLCEINSNGKILNENSDSFPNDELAREKLQFRLNYLSNHLETLLSDAVIKLYNESALATEFAKGELKDPKSVVKVLQDWRGLVPENAHERLKIPKAIRGRKSKLDEKTKANLDTIYDELLARFKKAKEAFNLYKKLLRDPKQSEEAWLAGWNRIASTILPAVPLDLIERFNSRDSYESTPSAITLEYLTRLYDYSPDYMEKLITQARDRKGSKKRRGRQKGIS